MAKYDYNWWFGKNSIYQEAHIDDVVGSNVFQSGVGGFFTGALRGISAMLPGWSSRSVNSPQESQSVIQGIPNWALGVGIVYLAMRK